MGTQSKARYPPRYILFPQLFDLTLQVIQDVHMCNHYYRKEVEVITLNGPANAFTYFACDEAIIEGVEPAYWYRDLCNSPLPCMSNLKL